MSRRHKVYAVRWSRQREPSPPLIDLTSPEKTEEGLGGDDTSGGHHKGEEGEKKASRSAGIYHPYFLLF